MTTFPVMSGLYTCDDDFQNIRPMGDFREWALWHAAFNTQVALTKVRLSDGTEAEVSTVFLGVDMNTDRQPMLFETLIFANGRAFVKYGRRYPTVEEARRAHDEIVNAVP